MKHSSSREYYSSTKRRTSPTMTIRREERWALISQEQEVLSAQRELRHLENKFSERNLTAWESQRLSAVRDFIADCMQQEIKIH